jgi:hypothetical protein
MAIPYQNPISASQITGPFSVARTSPYGTNFKVLNVVHSIEKKHSVFIVVEEFNEYPDKK